MSNHNFWTAMIEQQAAREKLERDIIFPFNKASVLAAMQSLGIAIITVTFDGCGDSGQIEHIDITPMAEVENAGADQPYPLTDDQIAIAAELAALGLPPIADQTPQPPDGHSTKLQGHSVWLKSIAPDAQGIALSHANLADAIETLAYDCLGSEYGSWGNDAGAFGQIVLNVCKTTLTIEFNERFETSNYYETTI